VPKRSIAHEGDGIVSKKLQLSPEGTKYSLVNNAKRLSSGSNLKTAANFNTPNSNFILRFILIV
jgi:hypothetical protein